MLRIAIVCLLACFHTLYGSLLDNRLQQAKSGDYLVMEGGKMVTILSIRSTTPTSFILEEISIPSQKLKKRPTSWAEWIKSKAPGHTSWSMMEIDKAGKEILECYSFSKSSWIQLSSQESLVATLLSLPMELVPDADKRKIGPAPQPGEPDLRKIWSPPVLFEGKKKANIAFDVYQTTWPKDGSELSGHRVLLYFDKNSQFPFPFWIQIETAHVNVSLRTIDAGKNLPSPYRSLPRRIPEFIGQPQKTQHGLKLVLKSPKYYRDFDVFAIDVTNKEKQIYPVPYSLMKTEADTIVIEIAEETLNEILEPDHRYTWLVVPTGYSESYIESTKPFCWVKKIP